MPYPMLTPLPQSPSRVTDPDNFVAESAVFLNALPTFQFQTNELATYINAITYNYNNLGTLTDINPVKPNIPDFSSLVISGTGVQYVSSIDTSLAALQGGSLLGNMIGVYVDAVNAAQGDAPSDDVDLPDLSFVSTPPTRAMIRDIFNSNASSFTATATQQSVTAKNYLDYVELKTFGDEDFGLITDNNIESTFDCGLITDTTITL